MLQQLCLTAQHDPLPPWLPAVVAVISMVVAALVEVARLKVVDANNLQYVDYEVTPVPMSIWWQVGRPAAERLGGARAVQLGAMLMPCRPVARWHAFCLQQHLPSHMLPTLHPAPHPLGCCRRPSTSWWGRPRCWQTLAAWSCSTPPRPTACAAQPLPSTCCPMASGGRRALLGSGEQWLLLHPQQHDRRPAAAPYCPFTVGKIKVAQLTLPSVAVPCLLGAQWLHHGRPGQGGAGHHQRRRPRWRLDRREPEHQPHGLLLLDAGSDAGKPWPGSRLLLPGACQRPGRCLPAGAGSWQGCDRTRWALGHPASSSVGNALGGRLNTCLLLVAGSLQFLDLLLYIPIAYKFTPPSSVAGAIIKTEPTTRRESRRVLLAPGSGSGRTSWLEQALAFSIALHQHDPC